MTAQIQSALLENPAGRFCLIFQKDPSAREGGTVVAATPQRVGKINAVLRQIASATRLPSARRGEPIHLLRYSRSI